MAVYHMYCAETDADVAAFADPALRRYQAFTKATDLSRQAYRDPVAYKDWKGFFENRETITLEQMKAERAVIGRPEECIEKLADAVGAVRHHVFQLRGEFRRAAACRGDAVHATLCGAGDARLDELRH